MHFRGQLSFSLVRAAGRSEVGETITVASPEVAACKYPPLGKRGAGAGPASLRWPAPAGSSDFADRNAMVVIILEEKRAVEKIDEIAAAAQRNILPVGRPAARAAAIERYRGEGFSFFQASSDLGFLAAGARELLAPPRKAATGAPQRPLYEGQRRA